MKVIVAGGTGLVGSLLLERLSGHDLTLIGRRTNPQAPSNAQQLIGEPADWPRLMAGVNCDVAISTLGSTMAQAGSKAAFAEVDQDAVIAFAKAAKACGAWQFMIVSSVGANAKASNFYLATKGQAEDGVKAIGFDRLDIFRPGLLRGKRGDKVRPVERLMINLSPITNLLTPRMFDHYLRLTQVMSRARWRGALAKRRRARSCITIARCWRTNPPAQPRYRRAVLRYLAQD